MQVAKWGNSLAVRLPADLVRELGLKEGDQIDLVKDDGGLARLLWRAFSSLAEPFARKRWGSGSRAMNAA